MCRQEGHYTRDCPCAANQKPIETKMRKMQTLLRLMTPTEKAKFRKYVLNNEEKPKVKTPIASLSRETSPHANQTLTAVLPSRETSPHTSQVLKRLVKVLKQCEECNGKHPTQSDTLHGSEGSEDSKPRLTTDQPMCPTKTVTFSLPEDRPTTPKSEDPSYDACHWHLVSPPLDVYSQ